MSVEQNFTSLSDFYKKIGFDKFEGHSGMTQGETKFLREIIKNNPNIKTLLEIGFNAGHSSESFLSSNETVKVWSFDIGEHFYVATGKSYIDHKYPQRHTLTIGDSKSSIPMFADNFDMKFDCIFIDGDHSYEGAMTDLMNCKRLAHKDTILIMDDIVKTKNWIQDWNKGANKAWYELVDSGAIIEEDQQDFKKGVGVSYGKYIFT